MPVSSVKPENIIVGPDGVKLIDFGLSFRLRGPKTSPYPGALVGTVNYLAPVCRQGGEYVHVMLTLYRYTGSLHSGVG